MGSGKTTIGRMLARRTGWPYHDNDELVSLAYGKNARELLASAGEAALRLAEAEALEASCPRRASVAWPPGPCSARRVGG
jgi:shikimate kinase